MNVIRSNGMPTIILSADDKKRIEKIDSAIFIKPSVFPKNAKVAKWKQIPRQLSLRERIFNRIKGVFKMT